jgi:hypothetical protein
MTPYFKVADDWRSRGFAALRVVAFVACFVVANLALNFLLSGLQRRLSSLEDHIFLAMSSLCLAGILLTALLARVTGRHFSEFGLGGTHRFLNFGIGVSCGIAALCVQLLLLYLFGNLSWSTGTHGDVTLIVFGIKMAVLFLVGAVTEEMLFRGYLLVELTRAVSFWPAAVLLAALFGAFHWLKGGGENLYGGVQAFMIGLAFAVSFRMTGTLWIAIGTHFGWNFAQSFIFGLPNSALVFSHHLFQVSLHGLQLWTGGSVGPEGSLLSLVLVPLVLAASRYRRQPALFHHESRNQPA